MGIECIRTGDVTPTYRRLQSRGGSRRFAPLSASSVFFFSMEYGSTGDRVPAQLLTASEKVAKAVGNARRLQLLEILIQGERPVEAVARESRMALSTASAHLQVLRSAGLVHTRRQGTVIFYRTAGPEVAALLAAVGRVARTYTPSPPATPAEAGGGAVHPRSVGADTRVPVIDAASVTSDMLVLDVRPRLEYDAGHFPGAVSIPLDELSERWPELNSDRYVVVYCRSEWCSFAHDAALFLRAQGVDSAAMAEGVVEWQGARTIGLTQAG